MSARPETRVSRREMLAGALLLSAGLVLPRSVRAESPGEAPASELARALAAAKKSPLIYVSPLKSNDLESRCHAEVWFVTDGDDLLVVTNPDRWRAACIGRGLDRARIWVGDFGVWNRSNGAFRKGPRIDAHASLDADRGAHERALEAFGKKYADEWSKWGPRFREGLASGERVLIRYAPMPTSAGTSA